MYAFWVWLLSGSVTRFICVMGYSPISLIVTIWHSMWTHRNRFVKSLFYHWQAFGWFWFLATVDSVAVNILIRVSGQYASLLGVILRWVARSKVGPGIGRQCPVVFSKLVPTHSHEQSGGPSGSTRPFQHLIFFVFYFFYSDGELWLDFYFIHRLENMIPM